MPENPPDLLLTVLLSQPLEDFVEEVVSKEFLVSSTMTPELFSDLSLNKLLETLSLILSTPEEKLSPPWMWCML